MEGRRVTSKNKKTNPLFILFLCLVAAVAVLLIVSIVLGARLGSANKKLKDAEAQVKELTASVSQLEQELSEATKNPPPALPSANTSSTATPDTQNTAAGTTEPGAWLDLTGHDEVKVKPTQLLDGFVTYYTTAGVNMRGGPATSYARIMTVDYGTKVEVAAQENNWSFVRVDNKFGWISSDYLSSTEPSGQAGRSEATSGSIRR